MQMLDVTGRKDHDKIFRFDIFPELSYSALHRNSFSSSIFFFFIQKDFFTKAKQEDRKSEEVKSNILMVLMFEGPAGKHRYSSYSRPHP